MNVPAATHPPAPERRIRRAVSRTLGVAFVLSALVAVALVVAAQRGEPANAPATQADPRAAQQLAIPESLRARHQSFHAEFVAATQDPGKVGDAARSIETLATTHFARATDAFPPLGLLPRLAAGEMTPEMGDVVANAEDLRARLPQIRREHHELVVGLQRLAQAADDEGKPDARRFAEALILHIQEEEEILYPAVLLIGDHVKTQLARQ